MTVSVFVHVRVVAQEASQAPQVGAGKVTGSTYFSQYFQFSLTIPTAWSVYDSEGRQLILEKGHQVLSAKTPDKKTQEALDAAIGKTTVLLTVSKLPRTQTGPGNASFACGAERLPAGSFTGRDYLISMKTLMLRLKDPPTFEGEIGSDLIGGAEFAVLTLSRSDFGVPIGQRYWSIVKKGHAIFCISSYANEDDKRLLNETMNSLKFQ